MLPMFVNGVSRVVRRVALEGDDGTRARTVLGGDCGDADYCLVGCSTITAARDT